MLATLLAMAAITVCPFSSTPDWGAMMSQKQWNRTFSQYRQFELVVIPEYNIDRLTIPMKELLENRNKNKNIITEKLYYSTRFMGKYDLDSGEYSGAHNGIDLKEPLGTPVAAIGAGRVITVRHQEGGYGKYIVIKHKFGLYSLYGHLESTSKGLKRGTRIRAGKIIGEVGMTGNTSAPHLHLSVYKKILGKDTFLNPIEYLPTSCSPIKNAL